MGQILHKRATTTHATRAEIQNSEESIARLAERYNVNFKTILKWKSRDTVEDAPMGPRQSTSVLSELDEALVVAFRMKTLLPLDDVLYALQPVIPHLSRSNLHRCLQRHGISRLPKPEPESDSKKRFKQYEIGYFHLDICEVRCEEGKFHLFVAVDRTSKFSYAELHPRATRKAAADFLENLVQAVPYKIHTVLTDNGIQFTSIPGTDRFFVHVFERVCRRHTIEHRLTKPNHPWTNGQVERMNRTIKEATVKQYHYATQAQLKGHIHDFLVAYNFAKRLKSLNGKTPYEYICYIYQEKPKLFTQNPIHFSVGLNT